ncbi:helix-turn-helix domain-containing protein [Streptomyces cacaoi]|uniref:helix-turn-helix domain-containing protein n=1 Tax=Streptomyces cacaoi TaxID=1898 RepID=UPI0011F3F674|nr:helix-turn-helix transcriptional regulator [Streptomyces cacaoi]
MSAPSALAPGDHLRRLREERKLSRARLSRMTQLSASYIEKIETGDRPLTPTAAHQFAKAFGLHVEDVMGAAPVSREGTTPLAELEEAMRDYDIPTRPDAGMTEVAALTVHLQQLRDGVVVSGVLAMLPELLRKSTSVALTENSQSAWTALSDLYSCAYWLAARHRWRLLAELAIARQQWAVAQQDNPVSAALADRDRAGTYLNFGDIERGLDVVDRAIVRAETRLSGEERAYSVGILSLRGMTLAGRLTDKGLAKTEAERHIAAARAAAEDFGPDRTPHGLTFGPANTETHVLATQVDLGEPRRAIEIGADADACLQGLPVTRRAPTYINIARAQLDVGDRDGALESVSRAWDAAPEMARIHPMGREVVRVLSSMHRRSNEKLVKLAQMSGIPF